MIKYPMIFHDGQAPSILHYIFQQHSLELTERDTLYKLPTSIGERRISAINSMNLGK